MLIVDKIIPHAHGLAASLLRRAAAVELPWDLRQKSRFDVVDSFGRAIGFVLPRGTVLRGGDAALAQDGSLLRVLAAPQAVLVVRTCSQHGTSRDLLRAAYHLANRHVPLELQADHLKLEADHVLADMLRAMHLMVTEEHGAFEPEGGAYAAGEHRHGPGDSHDHEYDHGHVRRHGATPTAVVQPVAISVQAAPEPHAHGPSCGHGHGNPGH